MTDKDKRQETYKDFEVPDPGRIRKVVSFIDRAASDRSRKYDLLEFGACKKGVSDSLSGREHIRCCGVDINGRTLSGVRMYCADVNHGIPQMDVKEFDFIFAGEFIEHLFDEEAFIEKCFNMLKTGGYFIITVPNLHFLLNRLLMPFGRMPFFSYDPAHYHIYSKKIIKEILRRKGFKVEKIISSHILFPARINFLFGTIFEALGDVFPSLGGHLILFSRKP